MSSFGRNRVSIVTAAATLVVAAILVTSFSRTRDSCSLVSEGPGVIATKIISQKLENEQIDRMFSELETNGLRISDGARRAVSYMQWQDSDSRCRTLAVFHVHAAQELSYEVVPPNAVPVDSVIVQVPKPGSWYVSLLEWSVGSSVFWISLVFMEEDEVQLVGFNISFKSLFGRDASSFLSAANAYHQQGEEEMASLFAGFAQTLDGPDNSIEFRLVDSSLDSLAISPKRVVLQGKPLSVPDFGEILIHGCDLIVKADGVCMVLVVVPPKDLPASRQNDFQKAVLEAATMRWKLNSGVVDHLSLFLLNK